MPGQHPEEEVASVGAPAGELGRSRPLAEGAQFAAYEIVSLLGSGGLARVYRARHQTLGHEVALKIFEPAAAPGPSGVAVFLREAHLAASVHHPHVVQTQDAGVHDGAPYLVMELLEGRDLEAHLRVEHTLEELALIELAVPIVAALMALHAQGLVHGDLGPGNIFLVREPQRPLVPKLLDIGISKPHRRLRLTAAARQRLMGSPLYMAPEAMLGHELTPASDQYSLGLILYECVTGVNPFIASSLKESVRLIIAGQRLAVLEQSVAPSPGLASIIERSLSVEPTARFPDLASLGRALLRLADQRTRAAWEFSFQSEPAADGGVAGRRGLTLAKPGKGSRWGGLGVALAVLGWVTAGVVSFRSTRPDPEQAYVMLGPSPSTVSLTQPLQPRPPAAALPPCPEATPADRAARELAGPDLAAAPELAGAEASAANPEPVTGASDVSSLAAAAAEATGLDGAGLELLPESSVSTEGGGDEGPAFDMQLANPGESGANREGTPQPARGTNNAPIFD